MLGAYRRKLVVAYVIFILHMHRTAVVRFKPFRPQQYKVTLNPGHFYMHPRSRCTVPSYLGSLNIVLPAVQRDVRGVAVIPPVRGNMEKPDGRAAPQETLVNVHL